MPGFNKRARIQVSISLFRLARFLMYAVSIWCYNIFFLLFLSFVLLLFLFFFFFWVFNRCASRVKRLTMRADKYQPRASVRVTLRGIYTGRHDLVKRSWLFFGSLMDKKGKGPRSIDCFELHFGAIHDKNQILEVVDCRFAFKVAH